GDRRLAGRPAGPRRVAPRPPRRRDYARLAARPRRRGAVRAVDYGDARAGPRAEPPAPRDRVDRRAPSPRHRRLERGRAARDAPARDALSPLVEREVGERHGAREITRELARPPASDAGALRACGKPVAVVR